MAGRLEAVESRASDPAAKETECKNSKKKDKHFYSEGILVKEANMWTAGR